MAQHDTIGDYLTIIRNAYCAGRQETTTSFSKVRAGIAAILKDEGYLEDFAVREDGPGRRFIDLKLKYVEGTPAIVGIERYSKPGCRLYAKHDEIPRVLGGLGIAILTTSRGILHGREARRQKVGGEVLCKVW